MTRWWGVTPETRERLSQWLLPAECLECQRLIPGDPAPLICALCQARWRPMSHPHCPRCQHPCLGGVTCRLCAGWPAEFGPVRSAVWLDDPVRRAMHAFKYRGWRRLATPFAAAMRHALAGIGPGPLVPVPTDRRRVWQRGYDQAVLLASALGKLSGREVLPDGLRRVRLTGSQVRLTPEERLANLAGVFDAGKLPEAVVLVDDVFTTGATLLSAAGVLRGAGVARIAGITFARAEPPLVAAARRASGQTFFGSERF